MRFIGTRGSNYMVLDTALFETFDGEHKLTCNSPTTVLFNGYISGEKVEKIGKVSI